MPTLDQERSRRRVRGERSGNAIDGAWVSMSMERGLMLAGEKAMETFGGPAPANEATAFG
jgi:hypothetical protein